MPKRAGFEIGQEIILPGQRRTIDLPVSSLSQRVISCPLKTG